MMSFYRVLNAVLQIPRTAVVAKRNVSEYAKRFGYKIKVPDKEVKVKPVQNLLYIAGAVLFFADMAWDKQKHYEVFTANFDEAKKYYKPETHFGYLGNPNMDFLIEREDSNREYHEERVPITKQKLYPTDFDYGRE